MIIHQPTGTRGQGRQLYQGGVSFPWLTQSTTGKLKMAHPWQGDRKSIPKAKPETSLV